MEKLFIILVGLLIGFGMVFLGVSAVYAIIAWAFDIEFSWKYAVGVTVIWMLVVQLFQNARPTREKTTDEKWNDLMRRR